MPRMRVQRAGHDDRVQILHVKQTTMVVKRRNSGGHFLGLIMATTVDVCDRDQLSIRNRHNFLEQILSAISHPNHANPQPVVSTKDASRWIGEQGRGP